MEHNFVYGMDVSSLLALEQSGSRFFAVNGEESDLLVVLQQAGVKSIRLRLWVDPKSEDGLPYSGGDNDIETTITLAKRASLLGFSIVLDFHYSDFWADPGKQIMPKAWRDLSFSELVRVVYLYTSSVLLRFNEENIKIAYVQVGNEITNGMLWPHGKLFAGDDLISGGYERLSALLNAGIRAVREQSSDSRVIIHLDRGGDQKLYATFFNAMYPLLSPFDIIGLSYYPYWHGTLSDLTTTINYLKKTYVEDIMIMETSYAYSGDEREETFVVTDAKVQPPNGFPPYTKDGQAKYLNDLLTLLVKLEVAGLYYWEPAWLRQSGVSWASEAAIKYIHEEHKQPGNEWANQALFDDEGHPLPALYTYKSMDKGEKR